jgi:dTDP-4-dehydrorhamnose reductase
LRLLVTGLGGTVGPELARVARAAGAEVLGWDRERVPPEDTAAVAAELARLAPTAIAHLGFGPESWAAQLAAQGAARGIPMLMTSTAMVFHHAPDGPHGAGDARTAQDDYGRYKIRCEDAVRAASDAAGIVRLGWQIRARASTGTGANHMLAALDAELERNGRIDASTAWRPACSFLDDTAHALWAWLDDEHRQPGRRPRLWQIDANADGGHDFAQIARALGAAAGRRPWPVREHRDHRHDQRLVGGTAWVPPLRARLHGLR